MYYFIKRIIDIVFSLFLMFFVILTFPFVALGIKISSPGPIIYKSNRAGKNGSPFAFYKYRSMHIDNGTFKGIIAEQKRVFGFGKLLRRTKIDELPQAFNVLKGDLSIVGPRPMLPTNVDRVYGGRYAAVKNVKPGLTSYASLFDYTHGDACVGDRKVYNEMILPIKQELELYYIEQQSIFTDIKLIIKTIVTIVLVVLGKRVFAYPDEYYIAKSRLENLV